MGAEQFDTGTIQINDPEPAFRAAVEQAQYDYGHAGYTGTIAEKDSYVIFTPPTDRSVDEVIKTLEQAGWSDNAMPEWLPRGVAAAYDDKWGPAVAIPVEGGWRFVGYASS